MSAITLYSWPEQLQCIRIRAIASFGKVPLELAKGYTHMETNKTPEFLAKFPHGKVPAIETPEGFTLFESAAIAKYIASLAPNSTLLPSSKEELALVDQWTSFGDTELLAYAYIVLQMIHGTIPYNKVIDNFYREKYLRSMKVLNEHLASRTYLVNERITLADITIASILRRSYETFVDAALRKEYANTVRFYETVANQESIKSIFPQPVYVEKAVQYTPPAKEKKEKKDAAPAPPKEKAAAKPKPAQDDDDDDEPLVPEEPKAKNPLDSLPKSSFNLEDWKRAYSNLETRGAGGSLEWFYKNFDKEGFSLWRVDFKYNSELTLTFMSSNQIGGFFNRLEASRKYLFGSMGVLGETNNSVISGVLICRGLDHKAVVDCAPDWESYEYSPINLEDETSKAFFEAALAWDLEIDGKKWADGKNFK